MRLCGLLRFHTDFAERRAWRSSENPLFYWAAKKPQQMPQRSAHTNGRNALTLLFPLCVVLREKGKSLSRNTKPARLCGGSDGIDGLAAYEKLPERIPLRQFRFFF